VTLNDHGSVLITSANFPLYGVGVEKVEEALKVIEYAGIATVQIIFNSPE
jgi:hypothetical protein